MRLPKRIEDVIRRKELFIQAAENSLDKHLTRMQSMLITKLNADIIPKLDVVNGMLRSTLKNYRLLAILDKTYRDFTSGQTIPFVEEIVKSMEGINTRAVRYFELSAGLERPELFERVAGETAQKMQVRLGLDNNKVIPGGYFDSLVRSEGLLMDIKQLTLQAVTAGRPIRTYVKALNLLIAGDEKRTGGYERQFRRYAHDFYMQYDSAYSSSLAEEVGMKYFVYTGSLVKDSRDFCVAHKDKVFTREQAEEWRTWTPAQGKYPAGYEIKAKNPYVVPSYIDYEGYDPINDRGGYNCRHHLAWIDEKLAQRLLKSQE